jgi:hypothetical protein
MAQGVAQQVAASNRPKQTFQDQQVNVEIESFTAQNGREPTAVEKANIYADIAKRNAPPKSEAAFSGEVGKKMAERMDSEYGSAQVLPNEFEKLNQVEEILESGQPITGFLQDLQTNVERVKTLFVGKEKANQKIADTELLEALLGSDVFPLIGKLGIGARGMDTPAEREFLRDVFTGRAANNAETLKRLTSIRKKVIEGAIEGYNKKVDSGFYDEYFKAARIPKSKVEIPSRSKNVPDDQLTGQALQDKIAQLREQIAKQAGGTQ